MSLYTSDRRRRVKFQDNITDRWAAILLPVPPANPCDHGTTLLLWEPGSDNQEPIGSLDSQSWEQNFIILLGAGDSITMKLWNLTDVWIYWITYWIPEIMNCKKEKDKEEKIFVYKYAVIQHSWERRKCSQSEPFRVAWSWRKPLGFSMLPEREARNPGQLNRPG